MTWTSPEAGGLSAALTDFARRLREHEVVVSPGQLVRYHEAVADLDATDLHDLYWAGRTCLLSTRHDIDVYDEVFAKTFLGSATPTSERAEESPTQQSSQVNERVVRDGSSSPQSQASAEGAEEADETEERDLGAVASSVERLRHKDFAACTPEETVLIERLLRQLRPRVPQRKARRTQPDDSARHLDLRMTIRRSLRTHGEPIHRHWRRRRKRARNLVLLLDVSGSMTGYSRALLQFGHSLAETGAPLEVFCFGTRLTRVTESLHAGDPDTSLADAAGRVVDWDGGTRIGHSLRELLDSWRERNFLRGAVVIICSDGLERGDPSLLGRQMARLSRSAYRVIWVNPLKGAPDYEPATRGMRASLSHVDHFVAGDTLASLERLVVLLGQIDQTTRR